MISLFLLASLSAPVPAVGGKTVALKAGTVHAVAEGRTWTGGATVLVRDGKIVAVGKDVVIPGNAEVVDYGPDAVLAPGFVSANSNYAAFGASARTAAPAVRALDNVDFFSTMYTADLMGGVTSAYVPPARGRLIGGQGAVIKLAGEDDRRRVLAESSALHGAISDEARQTPGYWEIPVPATAQTGLGVEQQQLPHSLMGALVALDELVALGRGGKDVGEYGPQTAGELSALMRRNLPWRIDAQSAEEVRAISEWAKKERVPLVIEGASEAGAVAASLASDSASVIVEVPIVPNSSGRDLGRGEDDAWPRFDTVSKLVEAGVRTAIATPDFVRPRELRYAACMSLRGGLSREAGLRAITLSAAEILGVADRVGSLEAGKDGDVVVLNGDPLSITTSVVATWVDGELAWRATGKSHAVVIEAGELYLGDGRYMRPGQVLLQDGVIAEVGERVAHPLGATVVRGAAAMPGMIDALGFLGLEGSSRVPATDFKLGRIVSPGDSVDRKVAKAGITTVAMAPRGPSNSGAPILAYKPAGSNLDRMVVEDPCALRIVWTDRNNRTESGKNVRQALEKAVEYDKKWKAYDEALAKWTPPKDAPAEEPKADEKKAEGSEEKKDEPKKDDEKKDKDKKDKKKAEDEPLVGVWNSHVTISPFAEKHCLTLRLEPTGTTVFGSLRCDPISTFLVPLFGTYADKKLSLAGYGSRGKLTIEAEMKEAKLVGKLTLGSTVVEFEAGHTTQELPVAARAERRRTKTEEPEIKGKPKSPGVDEKLEPWRKALNGEVTIVVDVDRDDEIVACVDAFAAVGIKPVLYGADELWRVVEKVRGRIAGALLSPQIQRQDPDGGLESLSNRYLELVSKGVRIAFHSEAEEGAAELPMQALYAVSVGFSPEAALRALTSDAADMLGLSARVGRIAPGLDGDVLVLDGKPLDAGTSILRAFVAGEEVR
ncbi:MAG: amidohydrolase family protein [Planctomycetes bacterium]|nr:amidohydrolase family protein [Planctomycetota bacterium]